MSKRNAKREAAQALLRLSVDIELQLHQRTGAAPLAHHLKRSRERAVTAMYAMADVDPTNTEAIRTHQMHMRMHELLLNDLREIVRLGKDAGDYLDADQAEDIAESIGLDELDEDSTPENED